MKTDLDLLEAHAKDVRKTCPSSPVGVRADDLCLLIGEWGEAAEFHELLRELVSLDDEENAIGGGPGFKERKAKAWAAARERFEP